MKIQGFSITYQFYIIPTINVTYSKKLHGHRNVEFRWLKWGLEIYYKKDD